MSGEKFEASVIVIEDDEDTRDAFCDCLEAYGITILGKGTNGKEAIELYRKEKPDVVLMDVMMPGYDGFYGIKHILEYDPSAKIIMITADITGKTEGELKANGVGLVYKPYNMEDILSSIKENLPKKVQNVT